MHSRICVSALSTPLRRPREENVLFDPHATLLRLDDAPDAEVFNFGIERITKQALDQHPKWLLSCPRWMMCIVPIQSGTMVDFVQYQARQPGSLASLRGYPGAAEGCGLGFTAAPPGPLLESREESRH